jgi:hypothetical protein
VATWAQLVLVLQERHKDKHQGEACYSCVLCLLEHVSAQDLMHAQKVLDVCYACL